MCEWFVDVEYNGIVCYLIVVFVFVEVVMEVLFVLLFNFEYECLNYLIC